MAAQGGAAHRGRRRDRRSRPATRSRRELFERLLAEEYDKLLAARDNRDVHDDSKTTTLPIAREIVETYVLDEVKAPWYIDLLNINLNNHDLERARERIEPYLDAFRSDGTRITDNLDTAGAADGPTR